MKKPEEVISDLRNDEAYKQVISRVQGDDRKRIEATVEAFVKSLVGALAPVARKMADDPEYARAVERSMQERVRLVTSGSIDGD